MKSHQQEVQDWFASKTNCSALENALDQPIIKEAFRLLRGMTMADALSQGQNILTVARSGETLFGYDLGRASIFKDLERLSTSKKTRKNLVPTYQNPKTEKKG